MLLKRTLIKHVHRGLMVGFKERPRPLAETDRGFVKFNLLG